MRIALALAILVLPLAGCVSSESPEPAATEPNPIDEGPQLHADESGPEGLLTGTILDGAHRPLEGIEVSHASGVSVTTAPNGGFSFGRVAVGEHEVTASAPGWMPATVVIEVVDGEPSNSLIVLNQPDTRSGRPYQTAIKYNGYAVLTADPVTGVSIIVCDECTFRYELQPKDLESLVLDMQAEESPIEEDHAFWAKIEDPFGRRIASGYTSNPGQIRVDADRINNTWDHLTVEVYPFTFIPELNRNFEVIATAFYLKPAPAGWSTEGSVPPPTRSGP